MFLALHGPQSDEEEGHLSDPTEGLSVQSVTPLTPSPFIHHQRKLAVLKASVPPSSSATAPQIIT